MTTVKNPYPLCIRDEFPMVKIGNQKQCVAEYLDKHIGKKKIVDVVQQEAIIYYIFENGYELPLLCFCCATPLVEKNLDKLRRQMRGRRLESMAVETVPASDGGNFLEFQLEFSQKGIELQGVTQAIAPEAAARMRHPKPNPVNQPSSKNKGTQHRKKRGFG